MSEIPVGLCQCGCGGKTYLAVRTISSRGWRKGQPVRFITGHNYPRGREPKAYKGYGAGHGKIEWVHRARAERALGKPLPKGAVVHHVDGTKNPYGPLVICQDAKYHMLLHWRMRIKAAGGNPNTDRICCRCKSVKPHSEFCKSRQNQMGISPYCRPCWTESQREARARKRLAC